MIQFKTEKKSRRVRFNRIGIESHWNDFTQRVEKAIVVTQPVSRALPNGTEHRFKLA